ncbi:MAG TPA: NAD-dependent epimerase/dehydratase family protein, partial [Methanomassiliicoccales archaeon]|nr:NAD-dependent epimerase/dehydratase family protein [Methanomassiliicoccales archaeon]
GEPEMKIRGSNIVVTGCAGFIGSHLTDALLAMGNHVVGVDNLSAGRREFLENAEGYQDFRFVQADLLNDDLRTIFKGADAVMHLAANPDVRSGAKDTLSHYKQNIEVTYRVLEAMKETGTRDILFPSTSTVYGEPTVIPTPEDYGPLVPISVYGATKLACEALICSYAHSFDMNGVIFRFANVVGTRSTHNVLHDFTNKLKADPGRLEILGSEPGTTKSYVHVEDCVRGMIIGAEYARNKVEMFNLGSNDRMSVKDIADTVAEVMGLRGVRYEWTGGVQGGRGWIGDVKNMLLSSDKLRSYGWEPTMNSSQSIKKAVREIVRSA